MKTQDEIEIELLLYGCHDPLFCEVRHFLREHYDWRDLNRKCPWRKILKLSHEQYRFREKQKQVNQEYPDEAIDL